MSPGRSISRICDISSRVSTPPMWHITLPPARGPTGWWPSVSLGSLPPCAEGATRATKRRKVELPDEGRGAGFPHRVSISVRQYCGNMDPRRCDFGRLVLLHSDYDSLEEPGYARSILTRAFSVVNIHLMRAPAAFRCRSQATI